MRRVLRYLPGIFLVVAGIAVLILALSLHPICSCPSQAPGSPPVCSCPALIYSNPFSNLVGGISLAGGFGWLLVLFSANRWAQPSLPKPSG